MGRRQRTWSPRIGAAYRLNDKTSLRAAYGRYVTPWMTSTTDFNNLTTPGFTAYTGAYPMVQGVPVMNLYNPFPSTYPVEPAYQKTLGAYTGLGDSVSYYRANRPHQNSDRFNFLGTKATAQRHGAGCDLLSEPHQFRIWHD